MGDAKEITTWPKHRLIFYQISSSALYFDVKGARNAAIGISKEPGTKCDYWVVIGHNSLYSFIKKHKGNNISINTPNIISNTEYNSFWISWNRISISFGLYGESEPLLQLNTKVTTALEYVTFAVFGELEPVHWRFELPPYLEKNPIKAIKGGEVHWEPVKDELPDDLVYGGYEKEILYIVRGKIRGSLTPGKFVPSLGAGFVSWGGGSHERTDIEVLCGVDCIWVPTEGDNIPSGAIEGGFSENSREILYIGRVRHCGYLIPGKVQPSHKTCYIAYKEEEKGFKKYDILVDPKKPLQFANKCLAPPLDVDIQVEMDYNVYSNSDEDEVQEDNQHHDFAVGIHWLRH